MANVFAILSAIALAASLFLAMKNKDAYQKEIGDRQTAEKKLEDSKKNLENLTNRFNSTEKERKATDVIVDEQKTLETQNKASNAKAEAQKSSMTAETESNEKKIAAMQEGLPVENINELVSKVKHTGEEMASLQDEISSNTATLADLMKEKGNTEGTIAAMRKRNSDISNKISFFPSSSISSIYPSFGFVTIPVGSNAGVVPGSTLNVVRGGSVVGKLRVRSVESSRASADIVPESLGQDVTLMVGDKVVPATDAPAPGKPATATPADKQ